MNYGLAAPWSVTRPPHFPLDSAPSIQTLVGRPRGFDNSLATPRNFTANLHLFPSPSPLVDGYQIRDCNFEGQRSPTKTKKMENEPKESLLFNNIKNTTNPHPQLIHPNQ